MTTATNPVDARATELFQQIVNHDKGKDISQQVLVNDAIYMMRLINVKTFCEWLARLEEQSERSMVDVFDVAILPNRPIVENKFTFMGNTIDILYAYARRQAGITA